MYGSYGRLGAADLVETGSGVLLDSEGDKPIFSWLKEQASTIDFQNLIEQQQSGGGGWLGFGKRRQEAEAQAAEANRRAQQAELQAAAAAKKSKQYMMAAVGAAGLLAVVLVVQGVR